MEIQTLEIGKINPAVYNPRKDLKPGDPEYDKLKKSILEFDIVEPLVWNKRTGNLVGGHQRLKILKELGIKEVEVSVVDLSEVKEKALNLALNKIQGEWDLPRLKDLLEELDTGDFDIEITGFDIKEIEDLMNQLYQPEEGLIDDDAVPEAVESISRRGDLWSLGNHRLLCGDSTLKADVVRLMGGEKADMVFTDPPYGINLIKGASGKVGGGTKQYPTRRFDSIANDNQFFAPNLLFGLSEQLVIWGGNYCADKLPPSRCWFIWDKNHPIDRTFANCELAWTNLDRHSKVFHSTWDGYTKEGEDGSKVHPTQKPIKLFLYILSEIKGNTVLDLFGGSGSTLIACEKLGRRCYMMEIDEHYCDVIIERWQQYTGNQAVKLDGN